MSGCVFWFCSFDQRHGGTDSGGYLKKTQHLNALIKLFLSPVSVLGQPHLLPDKILINNPPYVHFKIVSGFA